MNELVALLIFPGLLFTLALALALGMLFQRKIAFRPRLPDFSFESAAGAISVVLAACANALLPWPLAGAGKAALGGPVAAWLALEGAFLLPLLPGLLSSSPLVNRATIREAQIGVAGRSVVWLAAGTLLWMPGQISLGSLPGWALLGVGALLALPAAMGFGPFAAERTLALEGAEHGLDEATAALLRFARTARGAVLLAATLLALIPRAQFRPQLALLVWVAAAVVAALVLERVGRHMPRMALPSALRWCWWRAMPTAAIGLLYLAIIAPG